MLFVKVMQMYTGVYLCNTILVTEIFCYQHLTALTFLLHDVSKTITNKQMETSVENRSN